MSNKSPKSLSELMFRSGSPVNELARQAAGREDLAAALRAVLPPEWSHELRSASVHDDGTLVVLAASPAWAARLRFEGESLLARGRQIRPATKRIKVRVAGAATPGTE